MQMGISKRMFYFTRNLSFFLVFGFLFTILAGFVVDVPVRLLIAKEMLRIRDILLPIVGQQRFL